MQICLFDNNDILTVEQCRVIGVRPQDGPFPQQQFIPKWPPSFIWVHAYDNYGAQVIRIPDMFNVKDAYFSYSAWLVTSLVANVAEIYEMFFEGTRDERLCHGWFLKYVHEEVNSTTSQYEYDCKKVVTSNKQEIYPPYQWENLYGYLSNELAGNAKDKKACALTELMKKCYLNDDAAGPVQTPVHLFVQTVINAAGTDGLVVVRQFQHNDNDDDHHFGRSFEVPLHCEVIIVHRNVQQNTIKQYDDIIVSNGHSFRARYLSYRNRDDVDDLRALAFVRHREVDYDGWWCLEKNSLVENRFQEPYKADFFDDSAGNYNTTIDEEIGLPKEALISWEVLVYVRTKDKMQEVVNDSFEALGGNLSVRCAEHNVPLVDSMRSCKEKCSLEEDCKFHSSYECPWTCSARICRQHLKKRLKVMLAGGVLLVPAARLERKNKKNEDAKSEGSTTEASNNDDDNSIPDPFMFTTEKALEILDDASYSDMFLTDGSTTVPSHMALDEDFINREEVSVPTTAATIPGYTRKVYARNGRRINAHIIYNVKGQCLLRTNNKLSMNKYEKGMLQGLLSTTNDATCLSYTEGAIFPDIFWKSNGDSSIVGSLTGTLWTDARKAATANIAGYHDHVLTRISNTSIGTSCNARYILQAFDVLSNINMRGTDDRTILNRGLRQRNPGLHVENQGKVQHNVHSCDVIDSRHSVNCLSSQLRDSFPNYFITMTCNSKDFPSMRRLHNIKTACISAINDDPNFDEKTKKDVIKGMEASLAVQNARTWQVCIEQILKYLSQSSDEILGKFIGHFARLEHQETEMKASGTNSHMHLIAFLQHNDASEEDRNTLYQRVRCSSESLFFQVDIDKMIEMGIIADEAEAEELREKSRIINVHECARCKGRCSRKLPSGEIVCKYVDYAKQNPDKVYGFIVIDMKHSDEATAILIDLNFLTKKDGKIIFLDKRFEAGKHVYPADRGEHFSPTNPFLFGLTRSDCNVIVCGRYMVSRYLAKYVASIDEVRFHYCHHCRIEI